MTSYTAPLADIRFVLNRLIGLDRLSALSGYDAVNADLADAVLDETAKIAGEVFAPLNHKGDKTGAQFDGKHVTMPEGCADAYHAFVEGGWNGLAVEEEFGGQGLPWLLAMPVQEMLQSANLGLALCTLLNQGAVELLAAHGSDVLKAKFLPRMVSGEWTGTMNLTEPQAGSDVGAVKCRAERDGDAYRIFGQKIFISYGDHDMAENIIHLVLARLPDGPEGTKGLSLFLVPKMMVGDDGALGAENDVHVVSIEHKLGQHVSPTCVMAYGDVGGAVGYLVGKEHGGIAAMFTMMNNARIGVGVQGLGLMERAYQDALAFARTRVQSRDLRKPKDAPVAIIEHPDVKRMLLWMRSHTEASRALAYTCAYAVDCMKRDAAEADRAAAALRVDLLTPLVKSWLTDLANEVTSMGVQVFGGMGYIEETGAAQHMRDARVLAIYEGTNGIQANDLVFRKLVRDQGAALKALLDEIIAFQADLAKAPGDDFASMARHLADALQQVQQSTLWVLGNAKADVLRAAASASPYLRQLATLVGGFYLIKSACLANEDLRAGEGDANFLTQKIITARFFAEHALPLCAALHATVTEGATATLAAEF